MNAVYCFLDNDEYTCVSSLIHNTDTVIIPIECDNWNNDLSPWPAAKVFPKGTDFSGGADLFLGRLTGTVIPAKEKELNIIPKRRYLAGYSLAGLFAVYAATKTDMFDGIASMSGSLWFDGFTGYISGNPINPKVKSVYLSLGDREKNAREPRMKTVETCTGQIAECIRNQGIKTVFELNPGGHFSDVPLRMAKGINRLTEDRF